MSSKHEKLVGLALYGVMLGMLISGSANTILMKVQNNTVGLGPGTFNHPFFQCAVMFVGELFCLGVYFAKLFINKHSQKKDVDEPPEAPGPYIIVEGKQLKT